MEKLSDEKDIPIQEGVGKNSKDLIAKQVDEKMTQSASPKKKGRLNGILGSMLVLVLGANLFVLFAYTAVVGSKLDEALALNKPQAGSLILINPVDCQVCTGLEGIKKLVSSQSVELEQDYILLADSVEAQDLIEQLSIEKLPALVFRSDEPIKSSFKSAVEKGSRTVEETTLIWEQTQPPYIDINTDRISGLVNVTYITDNTCSDCYDVKTMQKSVLNNFGIFFDSEQSVDISDEGGQELIDRYSITSVPTIILSKEAADYPWLLQPWDQVGTVEPDGSYVFRDMGALNVKYRDLLTNKINQ